MPQPSSWPETRPSLLAQLRGGQADDAWKAFAATYVPLLYGFCRKKGLQDTDAEDVTQRVLTKLLSFEYNRGRGRFRAWLGTVAGHEISAFRREQRRPGQGVGAGKGEQVTEQIDSHHDDIDWDRLFKSHILERAIAQVHQELQEKGKETEWRVFTMVGMCAVETPEGRHWEVVGAPDSVRTAATLGKPVAWVYKAKHATMKRLKEVIFYLAEDEGILR